MLHNDNCTLNDYVGRLAMRSRLNDEECDALRALPSAASRQKAGCSFVACGDGIDGAYVVTAGLVSSFKSNNDGSRQIMALHIRGDMADLPSLPFAEAVSGLQALTDVSLLLIPLSALRAIGEAYPAISRAFQRDSAVDAGIQVEWASNVGSKTARSRFAHLICEMAARYEQAGRQVGLSFELSMTQEQLAEATAMTPVHLNRTLMALRGEGLLDMRYGVVQIFDWPALTKIACFNPRYLRFGTQRLQ